MHDHAQSIIRRHIEDARQAAKLDADDPVRAEGHHIYAVLLELIADEIAAALDSRAGDAGEGCRSVAQALKQAFQEADPDATHRFDWADFGDYKPTDKGQAVVDALIRRLGLAEDYVEFADRRYQDGYADGRRSATPAPAVDVGKDHNGGRCPDCDDTGDVHRIDGEWLGTCHCTASTFSNPTTFGKPKFGVGTAVDAVPAGEVERKAIRDEIINTPETADFMAGVPLEAAHQRERWGADHDAGKTALDWFWLIGFLAQKAADAAMRGDIKKAKHHTISTGAALANWHAALTGTDIKMRPGISAEAQAAAEGRGALSLALQTDALSHGEGR